MYRACTAPLGVQTLYMDSTTHSSWDMQQVWGGMHSHCQMQPPPKGIPRAGGPGCMLIPEPHVHPLSRGPGAPCACTALAGSAPAREVGWSEG